MGILKSALLSLSLIIPGIILPVSGLQAADEGFTARMQAAMIADDRSADDKSRDAGRKPAEVLAFMGVTAGMTVLDLTAGGGYYTEMLSAAVGPTGKVYSQNTDRVLDMREGANRRAIEKRFANNRLANAEIWLHDIDDLALNGEVDFAMLALNLHDLYIRGGEDGTVAQLQNISRVLKPGGTLGVIDHVGIAGADNNSLHRIEPGLLERLLVRAGYTIESKSDLLANPEDDHLKNVFAPEVRGNTDRIVIRARKD